MDRQLTVKQGTLTETKADVLVNVIAGNSRNLAQCGAVANSMLKAGGKELQQYYEAETPPVDFGKDVAITRSSGSIRAKFIYHAVVRKYTDPSSVKLLYKMICKCLDLAVKAEQDSIAFPTVGCGKLGYEPTVVAQCFVDAVRDTRCTMKVYVVAFEEDAFKSFRSAINTKSGTAGSKDDKKGESSPEIRAEATQAMPSSHMQTSSAAVTDIPSDELDIYMRSIFPRTSDDELSKMTDHLRSIGIDEPADMKMLTENDLTSGPIKRLHIRKLLDVVAAEHSQASAVVAEHPTESGLSTTMTTVKSQMVILLLGETGVGKSTTINSFAIFLRCATLSDAENASNEELFLIPLHFSETDATTYQTHHIAVGEQHDANESHEKTGDSVTQDPKIHTLQLAEVTITIIDTPGVGDTSGIEKDKENVQKILKCITNFKHIDAICLLLRPNQARLEDRFKYCLTEILRQLHESARKNIVLCFTNGKAVNYRPGDTVGILKEFMSKDEILKQIEISPRTVYYLENEPVRYLAKVKSGSVPDAGERQSAADCWEKSTDQVTSMFQHIASVEKHSTTGMTSINDARRVIESMTPLLVDVIKCIIKNGKEIEKQKGDIKAKEEEIHNLPPTQTHVDVSNVIYLEEYKVVEERLGYSITVCASRKCSELADGNYVHTKVCDPHCRYTPTLRLCEAMNWSGYCKGCGCCYDEHKWETTRRKIVKTKTAIPQVLQIAASDMKKQRKETALRLLRETFVDLEHKEQQCIIEKNKMLEACAKLSVFLEQNSMMKSDKTNDLLHYLIPHIEAIRMKTPLDTATCADLEQLKNEYTAKRGAVKEQGVKYSALDVKDIVENLYKLPLKGQELEAAHTVHEESKADEVKATKTEDVHILSWVSSKFRWLTGRKK